MISKYIGGNLERNLDYNNVLDFAIIMNYKYDYNEECKSPQWRRKSNDILIRDDYTCKICGAKDKQLHVHHTWYNQDCHYWEHPNHQLITICCDCHEYETILLRKFRGLVNSHQIDENTRISIETCLQRGIPLLKLVNVFKLMGLADYGQPLYAITKGNIKINSVAYTKFNNNETVSQKKVDKYVDDYTAKLQASRVKKPSTKERIDLFINELKQYEKEYDTDYLCSFIKYWTCSVGDKLKFENEPDLMSVRLKNFKQKYQEILEFKEFEKINSEAKTMVDEFKKECNKNGKPYNYHDYCNNELDEELYGINDRLLGKVLYDMGYYADHINPYENRRRYTFKKLPSENNKILNNAQFSLLYEACCFFQKIEAFNYKKMSEVRDVTYVDFCDEHKLSYRDNTKRNKSLEDYIKQHLYPIRLSFNKGCVFIYTSPFGENTKLVLEKINRVYGFKLIVNLPPIRKAKMAIDWDILYNMDNYTWDLNDKSFRSGNIKSIPLANEYKDIDYYIQGIRDILYQQNVIQRI